jgi:SAM-dependent methyltransferase
MPLGKIVRACQNFHLSSLHALLKAPSTPQILVVHATPSQLCQSTELSHTNCTLLPIHTTSTKTEPPYVLPFPSDSFDAIIYQGIMDNDLDISRTVFELKRVLKTHGIFAFDATSRSLGNWIRLVFSEHILHLEPTHHRNWRLFVDESEMTRVLTAYNFGLFEVASFAPSLDLQSLWNGNGLLNAIEFHPTTSSHHYCMRSVNLG